MKFTFYFFYIFYSLFSIFVVDLQAQDVYRFKKADPQGSGKFYLGREIAPVMSHYGIGWLERSEREEEENVSLLLKNMALKPGETVADIGAGSGYHSIRMAAMVGNQGRIKAIDIQPEMLQFLREKLQNEGVGNVDLVQGTEKSLQLPENSVDKMLLVDVYHEFSFPLEMGKSMFNSLKKGGKVYLIEYRAEDPTVPIKTLHKMTEKQAIAEMQAVGFRFVKNMDNLPWQHCLIFTK